jgi:hypothetical protein
MSKIPFEGGLSDGANAADKRRHAGGLGLKRAAWSEQAAANPVALFAPVGVELLCGAR